METTSTPSASTSDDLAPPAGPAPAAQPAGETPAAKTGWRGWSGRTRVVLVLSVVWLVYTLVQPQVSGRWWLMQVPDLAPPPLFLVIPLVFLGMAVLRMVPGAARAVGAIAVVAVFTGIENVGLNWRAFGPPPPPAPAGAIRVVSWNTSYWHQGGDVRDFYDFIKSHPADVYVLQEYLVHDPKRMWMTKVDDMHRLREEFPGMHIDAFGELVTVSRFPVVSSKPLLVDAEFPEQGKEWPDYWTVKTLRTDLAVNGAVLSVYNVHQQVLVDSSADAGKFLPDSRIRYNNRRLHFRAMADDLRVNPNPSVMIGDFNTSQVMRDYRDIDGMLVDAIHADRSFFPTSWQSQGPLQLWRVDRAYLSPNLTVHEYDLKDPAGRSDHALQTLQLSMPR
jgi:endonuclease/exonuclease/phosphatase family metal-dependent hydrolase